MLLAGGRDNQLNCLLERFAKPKEYRGLTISPFRSRAEAFSLHPTDLSPQIIALYTAHLGLRCMPPQQLLSHAKPMQYGAPGVFGRRESLQSTTMDFKDDSGVLDTYPENIIRQILLSKESASADEYERSCVWHAHDPDIRRMYMFQRARLGPLPHDTSVYRGIISEEAGIFPRCAPESIRSIYVIDPLDGSTVAERALQSASTWERAMQSYLRSTPNVLTAPAASVATWRRVGDKHLPASHVGMNLGDGRFFYSHDGTHGSLEIVIEGEQDILLNTRRKPLRFRTFEETDHSRFVCHHDDQGPYAENLAALQLPQHLRPYACDDPGPLRPLLFTEESGKQIRPRFIIYNGEKIAEWAGLFPWVRSSGMFDIYSFSNKQAPFKGGHSMAPAGDADIFCTDGTLHLQRLGENPAQYRATLAMIYKNDHMMAAHLQAVGAKRLEIQ
ncbi:MAG: hypothetical protein ACOCWQ_04925 [Nanoarchaeota archaeon]